MTAITATQTSLTIDADTNPDELRNRPVMFTIADGHSRPVTVSGRFETVKRMNLGGGMLGVGGTFVDDEPIRFGASGRTGMFVPDGTTAFLAN